MLGTQDLTITVVSRVLAVLTRGTGSEPDFPVRYIVLRRDLNPNALGVWTGSGDDPNTDSVGHIIAKQFGGTARHDDGGLMNVFPQNKAVNNVEFAQFENMLNDMLAPTAGGTPARICVRITFTFGDSSFPNRPKSYRFEWYENYGPEMERIFQNPRIDLRSNPGARP